MIPSPRPPRVPIRIISDHSHICDLIFFDGPLLCLFKSQKTNWLYLWADKLNQNTDRWIVFSVGREELVKYFEKAASLRDLLDSAKTVYMLDETCFDEDSRNRVLQSASDRNLIAPYLPEVDSYFDESLSPQIEVSREMRPSSFEVGIKGDWFVQDLDVFAKLYSQLYSIFYCTRPQFVANIGEKFRRYIRSPWTGGFSRVNLFAAMKEMIPSLHDLKIREIRYASPGHIGLEALESVNSAVIKAVLLYSTQSGLMREIEKKINITLDADKLKTRDLSLYNDDSLPITRESVVYLKAQLDLAAPMLDVSDELSEISRYSPNIVVTSKVFLSLLTRVRKLAELQRTGLLDI